MVLVRQELGDVLRDFRLQKGRTLRQVASRASVALGYLSEVERGQKEASSEILASVADALETPVSVIMREVGDRLAVLEGLEVPDALPADFGERYTRGDGTDTDRLRRPDLVAH
ncbi:helix-turn-helix domain-containing protein [Amnibacterium setariae]|jgi:transcriptional regulator with XRE-family HTH domain|uniref:XRE family transcriptional regulator n=1 Tax=Amnibacterium setariae TaxID=2306585 RepID=A0A3A1U4H9_9MICO|nr:helix-turn-helix transcriptional regulator [Amnibacterium setariae]RIX31220.1 XRE family transcriptional regulator [Amnibacterium setariae]